MTGICAVALGPRCYTHLEQLQTDNLTSATFEGLEVEVSHVRNKE